MPTPTAEDTTTPSDPLGSSAQSPVAAPKPGQPAATKQPETQTSIDPWTAPVEPSAEAKATESEVMAASLAGLEGDAWGGSAFGQDMSQPMAGAVPIGEAADPSAKGNSTAGAQPVGKATDTLAKGRPIGEAAPAQDMSVQAAQGEHSCYSPLYARLANNLPVGVNVASGLMLSSLVYCCLRVQQWSTYRGLRFFMPGNQLAFSSKHVSGVDLQTQL